MGIVLHLEACVSETSEVNRCFLFLEFESHLPHSSSNVRVCKITYIAIVKAGVDTQLADRQSV